MITRTTPAGVVIKHADHGLLDEVFAFIDDCLLGEWEHLQSASGMGFDALQKMFHMGVYQLPSGMHDVQSALYGPSVGDETVTDDMVTYQVRNNRPGPSRLIDRPTRAARGVCIVYVDNMLLTAYGTQADHPTPREWWDTSMKPSEALKSALFWTEHALSA